MKKTKLSIEAIHTIILMVCCPDPSLDEVHWDVGLKVFNESKKFLKKMM